MNRIRSLLSSISANQVQLMLFTDFRQIRVQIIDPRSFGSRWIKRTEESFLRVDSSVPLMHCDPSDLGSMILLQTFPKKRTLR